MVGSLWSQDSVLRGATRFVECFNVTRAWFLICFEKGVLHFHFAWEALWITSLVLYVDNDMFGKLSQHTDILKLHLISAKMKALKELVVENLECIIKT